MPKMFGEPQPSTSSSQIWERVDFLNIMRPSYSQIWELQKKRVEEIANGEARETLFICEHEPVITTGRRTVKSNILNPANLPVYEIERGGDATWHGPGQLVVYPIFKLNGEIIPFGLQEYLRFCEEAIIQTFSDYGLETGRFGPTGVWVRRANGEVKKIASIGVAVRRWVTYHGLSINLSNSFEGFNQIRPCNFESNVMTNAQMEGVKVDLSEFAAALELKMMEILKIPSLMNERIKA